MIGILPLVAKKVPPKKTRKIPDTRHANTYKLGNFPNKTVSQHHAGVFLRLAEPYREATAICVAEQGGVLVDAAALLLRPFAQTDTCAPEEPCRSRQRRADPQRQSSSRQRWPFFGLAASACWRC